MRRDKVLRAFLGAGLCWLSTILPVQAGELVLLFTGSTHAMLYPCRCPKEPDGGVARRASLIARMRATATNVLLVDAGGFFAAGLLDEYIQNPQFDSQRTKVQLAAMELMRYDAVAVGDDELNFGREFLETQASAYRIPLVSCNLNAKGVAPYVLKEVAGSKVGIIGVTNLAALQKSPGIELRDPQTSVNAAVEELKKNGVGIVVVLSYLSDYENRRLAEGNAGISILVAAHGRQGQPAAEKVGQTVLLHPSWQGRKLGKAVLQIENGTVADFRVEMLRLSDKIKDDPAVRKLLPACFSDGDCRADGKTGRCQNAATDKARCEFTEVTKVALTVIVPRSCMTCAVDEGLKIIRSMFPGVVVTQLEYPGIRARTLVRRLGIEALPAYLLGKEVEKEKTFDEVKNNLALKEGYYVVKPEFIGMSYFPQRPALAGNLDLFISLYDTLTSRILQEALPLNARVHFLAVETKEGFDTVKGVPEAEEDLRQVCVQQHYPQRFREYLLCRAKNVESSWWEDCLTADMDAATIRTCAKTQEGSQLLRQNIAMNKELKVMFGPTYLFDNREIFSVNGVLSKETLAIFLGKKAKK